MFKTYMIMKKIFFNDKLGKSAYDTGEVAWEISQKTSH